MSEYTFFVKPNLYDVTNKLLDEYDRLSQFINWGRRNPTAFAEQIFGIEFTDYQKWCFMMSWNTDNVVWCMTRNGGKSILAVIFLMCKSLLVPHFTAYILCGVGSQSVELYSKLEVLAKKNIPSFKTLTDVYYNEVIKDGANKNGFRHNPASYNHSLYNGSSIYTLNGAYDNNRSRRSNLNVYDECMNSPDELFKTSEPFTLQNTKFQLGVDYNEQDILKEPTPFANQLLYCSSAGSKEQYFYSKYRECAIKMLAGDKRYFCADINCDIVIGATRRGVLLPEPLLRQEQVDSAMEIDKDTALREYYNKFDNEGGEGQIISRSTIIKNSIIMLPQLKSEGKDKKYIIAYDPARMADNSAVVIGELYKDEKDEWRMKIVNCQTLMEVCEKKNKPKKITSQIEILKQILVDYNGDALDYDNIVKFLVDAGSGGAGVPITDFLCNDFVIGDEKHRGLIDNSFNKGDRSKYPSAIDNVLMLVKPQTYKSDMFEATIKMLDEGVIEFPEAYTNKGYIKLLYEVGKNGDKKLCKRYPSEVEYEKISKAGKDIIEETIELSKEQEVALQQIDAMKTEIVNIYRYKRDTGKDRFDLSADKANKLHDDRCYCFMMLGWYLSLLRREKIIKPKNKYSENEKSKYIQFRQPKRISGLS